LQWGCSEPEEVPAVPEPGGTLRIALLKPFDFLTPVRAVEPLTLQFMEHITPPLGRVDERGSIEWVMAKRPAESRTGLHFRLRTASWEDGVRVTAQDFVRTTQMMLHPGAPGFERSRFGLVKDVVAVNDSTLFFHLLEFLPQRHLDALIMPLPAHVVGEDADPRRLLEWPITRKPLSCGPFRVAESTPYRLTLERSVASGFTPPHLERVEVRTTNADSALAGLRAGEVDVIEDLPFHRVPEAAAVRDARLVALVGASYLFVGWNLRDARFTDPVVRQAAALAVDTRRIIHDLVHGQGDPSRGPVVPVMGIPDTTALLPYDRDAARRQLDRAGWRDQDGDGVRERRGSRLAFHLLVPDDAPLRLRLAAEVAADLREVGIRVEVRPLSIQTLVARLEQGGFEAFVGRWYPGARHLEAVWHSEATHRFNFGGFSNSGVDSLLQSLRYEEPGFRRQELLTQLQTRIYFLQPYLFLIQDPRFVVFADRVEGARPSVVSTFWNLPEWWIPRARQRTPQ
jgi:peptide/nickel transport system substrate-binding protein